MNPNNEEMVSASDVTIIEGAGTGLLSQNEEPKKLKCFRYVLESFDKGHTIFVPAPYNFCVFTSDGKIRYIKRQDTIDEFSNEVAMIEMTATLAKKLLATLEEEKFITKTREDLMEELLQFRTKNEVLSAQFADALHLYKETERRPEALLIFERCVEEKYMTIESHLNAAKCQGLNSNLTKAADHIRKAMDAGFDDWFDLINSKAIDSIIDTPEIVELIGELMKKNSKKQWRFKVTDQDGNDTSDRYIKKHGLLNLYFDLVELRIKAVNLLKQHKWSESSEIYVRIIDAGKGSSYDYYNLACCRAQLMDMRDALNLLEEAVNRGYINVVHMIKDVELKPLHVFPEFIEIVRRLSKQKGMEFSDAKLVSNYLLPKPAKTCCIII